MAATGKHAKGVSKTVKVTVYGWVGLTSVPHVNDEGMSFGSVDINGKDVRRLGGVQLAEHDGVDRVQPGPPVRRAARHLRPLHSSTTGGQAELGVLSDGTSVYDQTFDLEQTDKKTISLDTPLKIKLTATDTNADSDTDGFGAFGDAQAHCTQ